MLLTEKYKLNKATLKILFACQEHEKWIRAFINLKRLANKIKINQFVDFDVFLFKKLLVLKTSLL